MSKAACCLLLLVVQFTISFGQHGYQPRLVSFGLKVGGTYSTYANTPEIVNQDNPSDFLVEDDPQAYFGFHAGFSGMFRPSHFAFLKVETLFEERGFIYGGTNAIDQTFGFMTVPVAIGAAYKSLHLMGGLSFNRLVYERVDDNVSIAPSDVADSYEDILSVNALYENSTNEDTPPLKMNRNTTDWFVGFGIFSDYLGLELRYLSSLDGLVENDDLSSGVVQVSITLQGSMLKPFHDPITD